MKHSILILAILFLISSCNNDADGLITENATVYYYGDPWFGGSFCYFVIETESNKILVPINKQDVLIKLFPNYTDHTSKAKITYRSTKDKLDGKRCGHKGRTLNPVVFIEVIRVDN